MPSAKPYRLALPALMLLNACMPLDIQISAGPDEAPSASPSPSPSAIETTSPPASGGGTTVVPEVSASPSASPSPGGSTIGSTPPSLPNFVPRPLVPINPELLQAAAALNSSGVDCSAPINYASFARKVRTFLPASPQTGMQWKYRQGALFSSTSTVTVKSLGSDGILALTEHVLSGSPLNIDRTNPYTAYNALFEPSSDEFELDPDAGYFHMRVCERGGESVTTPSGFYSAQRFDFAYYSRQSLKKGSYWLVNGIGVVKSETSYRDGETWLPYDKRELISKAGLSAS